MMNCFSMNSNNNQLFHIFSDNFNSIFLYPEHGINLVYNTKFVTPQRKRRS